MTKHAITAILTFSILLVWNLDFAYGFLGAGLLGFAYLVILFLFASLLLTSIFRKRIKASLILSGHLAAILLSIHVSVALKSFKTQNTEKRGETIVNAIKKYRKAEEKYPNNLSELVPNYLDDVPKTDLGLLSSQSFGYTVERKQDRYHIFFLCSGYVIGAYSPEDGTWHYD